MNWQSTRETEVFTLNGLIPMESKEQFDMVRLPLFRNWSSAPLMLFISGFVEASKYQSELMQMLAAATVNLKLTFEILTSVSPEHIWYW